MLSIWSLNMPEVERADGEINGFEYKISSSQD